MHRPILSLLAAFLLAGSASAQGLITRFGAVGDGATLNTKAIQKAIDQLAADGGGTVVVPAGVFRTGALFLKPTVNLQIDQDGVLKGSTDLKDYPTLMTRVEGHFELWRPALINASHTDHLRISGSGTLDGSGQPFWDEFWRQRKINPLVTNLAVERPRLLFIEDSEDVTVSGIHLKDSGFWNFHLYRCNHVLIDGLNIQAGLIAPSSDGIDIDSSQNVTVQNCFISVNDDNIALKGSKGPLALDDKNSPPVEHIHITHCTFGRGYGLVTLGSEATIVRDVLLDHCKVSLPEDAKPNNLISIKLRPDTPQTYENIRIDDVTLDGPIRFILLAPWKQFFDLKGLPPPSSVVRNVTISNITGSCRDFGKIVAHDHAKISGLTLENIDLHMENPQPELGPIEGFVTKNVLINGKPYEAPTPTDHH